MAATVLRQRLTNLAALVAQTGLKLIILLPQPSEGWNCRHVNPIGGPVFYNPRATMAGYHIYQSLAILTKVGSVWEGLHKCETTAWVTESLGQS